MTRHSASWDPALYLRFQRDRERPFQDLLARVGEPASIVDAGCGAGNTTRMLQERWPDARVMGVDASPDMVSAARESHPGIDFALGDLRDWQPGAPVDMVVCNAVLHWLDDPLAVLGRMAQWLTPRGTIAVQVPANFDGPGHRLVRDLAASGQWPALAGVTTNEGNLLPLQSYAEHMESLGFEVDAWDTTYLHRMPDADAVASWYEGTTLRPHLAAGPEASFLAAFRAGIREAFPGAPVWFPFKRRFFVARRT